MKVEVEIPDEMLPTFPHGAKAIVYGFHSGFQMDLDGKVTSQATVIFEPLEPCYIEVLRDICRRLDNSARLSLHNGCHTHDEIKVALRHWEEEQKFKKKVGDKPGTLKNE